MNENLISFWAKNLCAVILYRTETPFWDRGTNDVYYKKNNKYFKSF